jgi:hypothetical protein
MAKAKRPKKPRARKTAEVDPNERTPKGMRVKTGVEIVEEERQRKRRR